MLIHQKICNTPFLIRKHFRSFSELYDQNHSTQSPKLQKRIRQKFEELAMTKKPNYLRRKNDEDPKNSTSFEYFQNSILPLQRRNTLEERLMTRHRISRLDWKFKVGDYVTAVNEELKGQKGEIIQQFPKRNTLIVEGMNIFNKKVQFVSGHKTKGIDMVEGPVKYEHLKHYGYSISEILFEKKFPTDCSDDLIAAEISQILKLCEFCPQINVLFREKNKIIFARNARNEKCYSKHDMERDFNDIQIGEKVKIDNKKCKILEIKPIQKMGDSFEVKKILIPKVLFSEGQNVISLHDDHFGKKAKIKSSFLNWVFVQFEGSNEISGPIRFEYFKLHENGKTIEKYHKHVFSCRVVKIDHKKFGLKFPFLPFFDRPDFKFPLEAILPIFPQKNEALNTPIEEAKKVTVDK